MIRKYAFKSHSNDLHDLDFDCEKLCFYVLSAIGVIVLRAARQSERSPLLCLFAVLPHAFHCVVRACFIFQHCRTERPEARMLPTNTP